MTQIEAHIQAHSKSVRDLLDTKKYSIDYYQREFKWERKHITELIEDLEEKFLESYEESNERIQVASYKPYYLGSIVISSKNGDNFIIDGQQRLTSLMLLLIFLHNLQKQYNTDSEQIIDVQKYIFSSQFGKKSFNLDIPERADVLDALYKGIKYEPSKKSESIQNILDRYEDITSLFPETLKNHVLPFFIDWLTEKVFLVQITAFTDDDAYTIFETMNDRGLSLKQSEMLKGYLLSQILDENAKEKGNEIWKEQVLKLITIGKDEELDFIKSWLRAKYAETVRERTKGASNKDFEKIGTEFHKWVRENKNLMGLNKGNDYYDFIATDFVRFSDYYELIRKASNQFHPDLETIYYNAHNNFTLQIPILLASLSTDDDNKTAKKKLQITARYIDIMIARRFANFRILTYSSLYYTMFILIKKIRDKDSESLVSILTERLNEMEEDFSGIQSLYLHQQNRRHIHYLLARITYHIEAMSSKDTSFIKYVDKNVKKPYEIEHLWANKYERHAFEFESAHEFNQKRNYFGGLILLPRGFNQSLKDDSYSNKVKHYIKDNLLAQSLNRSCYEKNPSFLQYIQESGLPFKPYDVFSKTNLEERQELYQMLCEEIWNPNRLNDEFEYAI